MNISPVTARVENGVAVARFSVDGQQRYVKAYYDHTKPEELRRDVQKHIDTCSQLPPEASVQALVNYGEVA